jgi:isoquinoline 1-oxidoreductase alpha subunit
MPKYSISVNGKMMFAETDADTPVLWVLRDHLNILGPKFGCGVAQCGACTIHLDGNAVRSCVMPISAVLNRKIITIEGLSSTGDHPLQRAWEELDVAQCGYCQAGQIMSAAVLLRENPNPTDEDIDNAMSGNICRCGTYLRIRKAIHLASAKLSSK